MIFIQKARFSLDVGERKVLVEPNSKELGKSMRCRLLEISRSSLYYESKGQYMKTPYYGRRRMTMVLRQRGYSVGERGK